MYERELKIAIQAVKKAEPTFRKYFGKKTKVEMKGGNYRNLVSYADKKIEIDIKKFLLKHFPNYGFIGEEYGEQNQQAEFVWVLDPIDGTTNFTQKIPYSAIVIALMKSNDIVLGLTYNPITKDMYFAKSGKGAYHNGRRIKTSKISSLEKSFGSLGWGKNFVHGSKLASVFIKEARKIRVNGSTALSMCEVANGRYDFFVSSGDIHLWDIAAGVIIVKEAGGITTDRNNQFINHNLRFNEIVCAANKQLHSELIRFIQKKKV